MTASQRQAVCCATRQKKNFIDRTMGGIYTITATSMMKNRRVKEDNSLWLRKVLLTTYTVMENQCLQSLNVSCKSKFEFRTVKLK